jgi:hypothetical protein
MKPVAVVASLLVPLVAHAQGAETTNADTLVVVTPSAPTIVVTNGNGAAPASAAPGAQENPPVAAPATAAPQNEPWSNVSHINGQLVPVGQRTDYLYAIKKTNISTNPIGLMFGFYSLSVSHAVTQNIAIRGDISGWSLSHGNSSGVELGVTAPIYFRRTYSGPFFEPGLIMHIDHDNYDYAYACADCGSTSGATSSWVGPQMLFGWQWIFDSGLNVAAAFGAAKPLTNSTMNSDPYSSSSDDPKPTGYFRIGYAF